MTALTLISVGNDVVEISYSFIMLDCDWNDLTQGGEASVALLFIPHVGYCTPCIIVFDKQSSF